MGIYSFFTPSDIWNGKFPFSDRWECLTLCKSWLKKYIYLETYHITKCIPNEQHSTSMKPCLMSYPRHVSSLIVIEFTGTNHRSRVFAVQFIFFSFIHFFKETFPISNVGWCKRKLMGEREWIMVGKQVSSKIRKRLLTWKSGS